MEQIKLFGLFLILAAVKNTYTLCGEDPAAFPCGEIGFYEAEVEGCKCCLKISSLNYECSACHKSYETNQTPLLILLPEKKKCIIPDYVTVNKKYAIIQTKYVICKKT